MLKFLFHFLKFMFIPFLLGSVIMASYFVFDPFNVVRPHDEFYFSEVGLNEDYVATERYLKQGSAGRYNAFILGSSRAGSGFNAMHWQEKIGKDKRVFSYAASNESIYGIYGKLRLLDEKGDSIKNVLLVICGDFTFARTSNHSHYLFIKHPAVSKGSMKYFQESFLKAYVLTGFFVPYLDYKIFHTKRAYMNAFLKFDRPSNTTIYGAFQAYDREEKILKNEEAYYRHTPFYERPEVIAPYGVQINAAAKVYLTDIMEIFRKHHTDYKIIISPLYDQKRMNEKDVEQLYRIFRKENVYDFSGKNEITNNKFNYYEKSHYRFHVGDSILKVIYNP
ncbi:MAG TPA: hypothetical protein VK750_03185 [Cytophagaceae bacterium]|jgi:hypothetical protein|nr:hypothetical protein [Cytophagaceae bacterium]